MNISCHVCGAELNHSCAPDVRGMTLEQLESLAIRTAISGSESREEAAKKLGVPHRTLYRRIKELGLKERA